MSSLDSTACSRSGIASVLAWFMQAVETTKTCLGYHHRPNINNIPSIDIIHNHTADKGFFNGEVAR